MQIRYDFQNPFHNYGFQAPSNSVDFKNPTLFGKLLTDTTTASLNAEPLMNISLRITW